MTASSWLSAAFVLLDVILVLSLLPRILLQRRDAVATLAWILFVLLLPLGGALLFFFLGTRRLRRRRLRVSARSAIEQGLASLHASLAPFRVTDPDHNNHACAEAARRFMVDPRLATVGNEIAIFHGGEEAFRALCEAIARARHHVHLEYYIFRGDETGQRLLIALEERARAGVEVRLLVDAVGSWELPPRAVEPLTRAGGHFSWFLPVNLVSRPFSVNLRNHRKISVIDGEVGFIGGMNIGDEYRGRSPEVGPWRDTHVCMRGPAVLRLQEIFAEDWHFATRERCVGPGYEPTPGRPGEVVVDVIESGPDRTAQAIYRRLFVAITRAEQRVWLTTPYFIPDAPILTALTTAAERGVDVRLLLPGHSDHRVVLFAGRAHYDELLRAGARVFEYQPGMLHAKTMVVDDLWTTIGSANMDRRSFHLNWEANLVLLDHGVAGSMADRFLRDLEHSVEIRGPYNPPAPERLAQAASALLSPLL